MKFLIFILCLIPAMCYSLEIEGGPLKPKHKAKLERMLQEAPKLAESFIKDRNKHKNRSKVELKGELPKRFVFDKGCYGFYTVLRDTPNAVGCTDGETVWCVAWVESIIWHEIAHCLFKDTAKHEGDSKDVCENFAYWCDKYFK